MTRLYIRIVGGAVNVLEQVLFWPSVGRFLKSTIVERDLDSEPLVILDVEINRGQSTIFSLNGFPKLEHMDLNHYPMYSLWLKNDLQAVLVYITWVLALTRGCRHFGNRNLMEPRLSIIRT